MTPLVIHWQTARFADLSARDVWDLLDLRSQVFVVEQDCVYQDPTPEDHHPESWHLLAREASGRLVGYARVIAPGAEGPEMFLGRFVTHRECRGQGLGHALVRRALELGRSRWPQAAIRLHAQTYLLDFYRSHGFEGVGEPYPLDGIPHQDMLWVGGEAPSTGTSG